MKKEIKKNISIVNMKKTLEQSQELAIQLIQEGQVDASSQTFDGVRALYQSLFNLPVTGMTCPEIEAIEHASIVMKEENQQGEDSAKS